jgi:hypothetical protein
MNDDSKHRQRERKMAESRVMSLQASLKELAGLGSEVDEGVVRTEVDDPGLEIELVGGIHDSRVFELEDGRAGYMLDTVITNRSPRSLSLIGCELLLTWEDELFEWLTPHTLTIKQRKEPAIPYEAYRFPGRIGLEFPRGEVINHFLTEGKRLSPERPIHGWLLAIGGMMPRYLLHGGWTDATLVITTSDHVDHCHEILLWTERLQARPERTERRSNLFGNPIANSLPNADGRSSPGKKPSPEHRVPMVTASGGSCKGASADRPYGK